MRKKSLRPAALFLLGLPLLGAGVGLATDNYGARAELRADGKRVSAPVTISIERMLTKEERDALLAVFTNGDASKIRKALAAQPDLGYVDRGRVRLAIKWAASRPSGQGKMVTVVCAEPMTYLGGDIPDVQPAAGFEQSYLLLSLDKDGKGTGEIAPAARLRVRDGSVVVAEYGAEIIDLEDVAWEK